MVSVSLQMCLIHSLSNSFNGETTLFFQDAQWLDKKASMQREKTTAFKFKCNKTPDELKQKKSSIGLYDGSTVV